MTLFDSAILNAKKGTSSLYCLFCPPSRFSRCFWKALYSLYSLLFQISKVNNAQKYLNKYYTKPHSLDQYLSIENGSLLVCSPKNKAILISHKYFVLLTLFFCGCFIIRNYRYRFLGKYSLQELFADEKKAQDKPILFRHDVADSKTRMSSIEVHSLLRISLK